MDVSHIFLISCRVCCVHTNFFNQHFHFNSICCEKKLKLLSDCVNVILIFSYGWNNQCQLNSPLVCVLFSGSVSDMNVTFLGKSSSHQNKYYCSR